MPGPVPGEDSVRRSRPRIAHTSGNALDGGVKGPSVTPTLYKPPLARNGTGC